MLTYSFLYTFCLLLNARHAIFTLLPLNVGRVIPSLMTAESRIQNPESLTILLHSVFSSALFYTKVSCLLSSRLIPQINSFHASYIGHFHILSHELNLPATVSNSSQILPLHRYNKFLVRLI